MKLKERVAFIDQKLSDLYPTPPIPLDHSDPYTLLIAVLLSAQCTDARVNQVTPALFDLAKKPQDMARKSIQQINSIVKPFLNFPEYLFRNIKGSYPNPLRN
jgi:endonuclease-3